MERVRTSVSGFLLFFLIQLLLISSFSYAGNLNGGKVRVGYYENEIFQEGAAEGLVKSGYAYEYYRKISEYTGWEYEYVYGDFSELYQMLLDRKIDLLAGLAYKSERSELISYPVDIMGKESYYLLKHDDDESTNASPSSLAGKSIGVLDSAMADVLQSFLDRNSVDASVVRFSDYPYLFSAFDEKKVDILACESNGAYSRENAEVLSSFGSSDYYLCVSKDRDDLLQELNEALQLLRTEEPNFQNLLSIRYYSASINARAFSAREKQWMKENSKLRVGYLDDYLPYSDLDSSGTVTGLVSDLMPKLLEELGIRSLSVYYVEFSSYDEMIEALNSDVIDVAFPVGGGMYYAENSRMYQSNAVTNSAPELVFMGNYSHDSLDHFAVNSNNRMQFFFVHAHYPESRITFYDSIDECLAAVMHGDVTSTTMNGLRASDILRNRKYRELSSIQLSFDDEMSFGVRIGNEALLKLINRGLNSISDDTIQELSYRYASRLYEYTIVDLALDNLIPILCILFIIGLLMVLLVIRDNNRTRSEARKLEQSRLLLEKKNEELARSREALSDALREAEHASRAKADFLANMSHDIRTPMNAIVGFTAHAESHISNRKMVKDYLEKISISSQHLLSLINDILDMSRIESGKVTIEEGNVHLPSVMHDLRNIVMSDISAKSLKFYMETRDVIHEDIITDRPRLNQIFLNILSNAIKFTQRGGSIFFTTSELSCEKSGHARYEFRIRDTGIGMSQEFQKLVFDAFTRENTSTVSSIQGTGLGMAITKNIVDMFGGTISVESKQGVGSEFTVVLVCRIAGSENPNYELEELKGSRALVLEDNIDTCLSICSMLRRIGLRPDWTNSSREAISRMKEAQQNRDDFKVVVLDNAMKDQDGIETAVKIRREIGESSPFIILTAYDTAEIENRARNAGVDSFCTKPLFISELRKALCALFEQKGNRGG
ncbi:MAG: transporter substrate-binding domain-containing protein [Spirochaetales bacterium]|nr:transporter substrate-binding domain-containing protein [Spirochaetales bacterium]